MSWALTFGHYVGFHASSFSDGAGAFWFLQVQGCFELEE
jgi:hypothetical protein